MNDTLPQQAMACAGARAWRQRAFAWGLAHLTKKYERFIAERKRRLFAGLSGTVLEIGAGTGANLRYLPKAGVRWLGIDPNPFMEKYLKQEADRLGLAIEIRNGVADQVEMPDASVDVVVSTLVLCCVTDVRRSLREILRVLRPGGTFLFIEHVAAPRGTWLRRIQNWVTPLWRQLGDGCHPNRETWVELDRAGFTKLSCERFHAPVPLVSPQIAGSAIK